MAAGRHRLWLIGGLAFLFFGLLAVFSSVPPALATPPHDVTAADVIVGTTDDETINDTVCSLREALLQQSPNCVGGTIVLSPAIYTLTKTISGSLTVASGANLNVTVDGGSAVIQGGPTWNKGILSVNSTAVVSISNVTFRDGNAGSAGGGGILNSGTLSLLNCQILSNTANLLGGGILNVGGTLSIVETLIMSNVARGEGQGGGIYTSGPLTLVNSAVVSNTAEGSTVSNGGGGVFIEAFDPSVTLENVTLSGNLATFGGGLYVGQSSTARMSYVTVVSNTAPNGGGIYTEGGVVLTSTILAYNDCDMQLAGNITSQGYNLIQSNCGVIAQPGDLFDRDPLLGLLQYHGGPTPTHALNGAGPALNRIPLGTAGCGITFITDQRGAQRPQSGGCDIGAFESAVVWLPMLQR